MNPRPATKGAYPLGFPDDRFPAASRGAYHPIVKVIKNPKKPIYGEDVFIIEEELSFGDDEEDEDFGYSKNYELQIFNPEGDLIKKIMREYDPVEVTEEEKEEATQGIPSQIKVEFPKYHPPFLRFVHDETGRLYVQSYEKGEGYNVYYHDVFDRDGRYIAKVQLRQFPVIFRNGKLYSLEEDEDGYQYIKRYKVTWKF